jgi:hypothetical protein
LLLLLLQNHDTSTCCFNRLLPQVPVSELDNKNGPLRCYLPELGSELRNAGEESLLGLILSVDSSACVFGSWYQNLIEIPVLLVSAFIAEL